MHPSQGPGGNPWKSSRYETIEEANRAGAQFLIADVTVALTFLDIADVTSSEETKTRNRRHARSAYDTVHRLLPRIYPSEEQFAILREKLKTLRNRLVDVGYFADRQDPERSAGE